jgi:uncharacterized protein YggE
MTQTADCIHVSEQAWGEIPPRAALLHVTLTGDKLFSGRAAFEKAIELRRLAMALAERDIPEQALSLEGATLDVSTGLFTRSSSVTYRVRVRIEQVDRIADALDAIAESKQARLSHIEWDYAGSASDELLATCTTRAVAKASCIARALGVTLGAVRSVHEEDVVEAAPYPHLAAAAELSVMRTARKAAVADELAGLELAPTKKIGVRVRLVYAIGASRDAS